MTWIEAESIKTSFIVAMQYADVFGKTWKEDIKEAAEKHAARQLGEAYLALKDWHEREIDTTRGLCSVAAGVKKGRRK
ncbi:MAG: hypothetical protein LBL45_04915 [Treponema sp.]|nr:hypothetical protein [Treponema sp.]